jgi:hypothetical protein
MVRTRIIAVQYRFGRAVTRSRAGLARDALLQDCRVACSPASGR